MLYATLAVSDVVKCSLGMFQFVLATGSFEQDTMTDHHFTGKEIWKPDPIGSVDLQINSAQGFGELQDDISNKTYEGKGNLQPK